MWCIPVVRSGLPEESVDGDYEMSAGAKRSRMGWGGWKDRLCPDVKLLLLHSWLFVISSKGA